MDETLESPTSLPPTHTQTSIEEAHASDSDGDEEETTLDWTKTRPSIPKRGEKEYEPRAPGGGSTILQVHILDRSRNAMFDTLRGQRSISSKAISYGIWHPSLSRTEITLARGIHFATMGHSASRPVVVDSNVQTRTQKRTELLPEESVYLIERGALFCWKSMSTDPDTDLSSREGLGSEDIHGSPMSVQQAYTEMLGCADMSLEKFQVYAHLKRLGYIITRAVPPSSSYPVPPPPLPTMPLSPSLRPPHSHSPSHSPHSHTSHSPHSPSHPSTPLKSLWTHLTHTLSTLIARIAHLLHLTPTFNWWHPIRIERCGGYAPLFRTLRSFPSLPPSSPPPSHPSHPPPSPSHTTIKPPNDTQSPYKIFYNIYKPNTPFKKTAPPAPDFRMVVVDARTTPLPTLDELERLFEEVPDTLVPVPGPGRRRGQGGQGQTSMGGNANTATTNTSTQTSTSTPAPTAEPHPPSAQTSSSPLSSLSNPGFLQRLLPWFSTPTSSSPSPPNSTPNSKPSQKPTPPPPPKPNPFQALKAGTRTILIAAVDSGNISFYKFARGGFSEWVMV